MTNFPENAGSDSPYEKVDEIKIPAKLIDAETGEAVANVNLIAELQRSTVNDSLGTATSVGSTRKLRNNFDKIFDPANRLN